MYLLLSLIIRYVQTPASTGYGLGSSVVVAGFILIPFSVLTVSASRVVPLMTRFVDEGWVIPIGCGAFLAATLIFRFERGQLWEPYAVMGLAGLGVGYSFAALPRLIMRTVRAEQSAGRQPGAAVDRLLDRRRAERDGARRLRARRQRVSRRGRLRRGDKPRRRDMDWSPA
jgi:hypothetical protein